MTVVFNNVTNKQAAYLNATIEANLNEKEMQVCPQSRSDIKFVFFGDNPEEKPIRIELWVNKICQLMMKQGYPMNYTIDNDTITFEGLIDDSKTPVHKRRVQKNK